MRTGWIVRVFAILLFVLIVAAGFGQAVLHLWNWVMPETFGVNPIRYGQALGLLGLCWILFGGWRGFPPFWGHRMGGRWAQMSPEERETFRRGMRGRCGHFGPAPAQEPKP